MVLAPPRSRDRPLDCAQQSSGLRYCTGPWKGRGEGMKWIVVATIVIGLVLGFTGFPTAQEQKAPASPGGSPQPLRPQSGTTATPEALMGFLRALPRPGSATPSQAPAPYPMFQIFGPSLSDNGPANPEAMGQLLVMQGEMMIKMGEVMMKYGQMLLEKPK